MMRDTEAFYESTFIEHIFYLDGDSLVLSSHLFGGDSRNIFSLVVFNIFIYFPQNLGCIIIYYCMIHYHHGNY